MKSAWQATFKSFGNACKRVATSSFAWLFICLLAFDAFLYTVKPLRYISMGAYIAADENPLFGKFDALANHFAPIDVLLLGSSFMMAASHGADVKAGFPVPTTLGVDVGSYSKSQYLEKLLSEKFNRRFSVLNMAGPSCMVSDALVVLENAIATGHKPTSVILGVGPRDFIDNQTAPYGQSAYCDFFKRHGKAGQEIKAAEAWQKSFESSLERIWHYYNIKLDYQVLASLAATSYLNRPSDLSQAVSGGFKKGQVTIGLISPKSSQFHDAAADQATLNRSLALYKMQYLPINEQRYHLEMAAFKKLLALCDENNIHVAVLNMPLTPENKAILPDQFRTQYLADITNTCKSANVPMVDLANNPNFTLADFNDSAHVTGQGAMKIWNMTLAQLVDEDQVAELFGSHQLSTTAQPATH